MCMQSNFYTSGTFWGCYVAQLITPLQVTDLEVELETTKQKNKENLQQAILTEREKLTQMQWDMEELRQKSLRMELKLQSKQVTN